MTTKEKVHALREQGLTQAEIADELGIAPVTVHNHLERHRDCLNRASFLAWLGTMTHEIPTSNNCTAEMINGVTVKNLGNDPGTRTYFAWRRESRAVTLYQADKFCCAIEAPLQHFFIWCHFQDRNPWHNKIPPHESPIDDVPQKILEVLKWHLRKRTEFNQAWRLAVSAVEMHESWNQVVPGGENYKNPRETRPINFMRKVFKKEYMAAQAGDERLAA